MSGGTRGIGNVKGELKLEDRSKLSQEIRAWRLGAGWTQKEAAKFIGVSAFYFSALECQSRMTPPKLNMAYVRKFMEGGLDLKKIIPDLEIQMKRVRGIIPEAQDISMRGEELANGFNKAMQFLVKAKEAYERKIVAIDQLRVNIDQKIENLMAENEELETQKKMLKDKIHKAELGIDNIKASMLPMEVDSEEPNELSS